MGLVNFLATVASIWTVRLAKNKTILLWGHFMIGLFHVLLVLTIVF